MHEGIDQHPKKCSENLLWHMVPVCTKLWCARHVMEIWSGVYVFSTYTL